MYMNRKICSVYLGRVSYKDGLAYQKKARELVRQGTWDGIVLLLQHEPVITIGRHGGASHLLVSPDWLAANRIELQPTNRGGDITCHNPGQLVCYPIMNLKQWTPDVHWYVRQLEESLIQMLQRLGIRAGRKAMYTGVWVGNKKLAAIGIGVRHWITFHGMALNICNDLTLFSHIIPCGITEFGVTSVQKQSCQIALTAAIPLLLDSFTTAFPHNTYTHFSDWGDLYERERNEKAGMAQAACMQ